MEHSAKNAGIDQNLSQRLHHALTATGDELYPLLQGAPTDVLLAALRNPALDEHHLLALLKQRGLGQEVFAAIYANKGLIEGSRVRFALVINPDTPAHIVSVILPQLTIFELLKVCLIPGTSADQRLAAERAIVQRIPTQPLGNKITLARRGTAAIVEALLREGGVRVVEACLDNPHLKEGSLHQFLNGPASTAETISMVARSGRWKGRPNIRLAILKNPRTPAVWFTLFLPGLPQSTVREILGSPRLTSVQKSLVRQALGGRPS